MDTRPNVNTALLVKRRISAFTGSDLEVLLRAVLADGCADPDPEMHTVLLTRLFPRSAEILTVEQWSTQLRG